MLTNIHDLHMMRSIFKQNTYLIIHTLKDNKIR